MRPLIILFLTIFSVFTTIILTAQTLPSNRSIDWSHAGVDGGVPCFTNIYDVTTLSKTADRVLTSNSGTTNSTNLNKILNDVVNYPSPCVFYFPAGTYNLESEVAIRTSGRVIRGESASLTKFNSNSANNVFRVEPQSSPTSASNDNPNGGNPLSTAVSVTAGYSKGSSTITVANSSSFITGQYFEIYQADDAQVTTPQTWSRNVIGMIAKIVSVNSASNEIIIDRPLRVDLNNTGGYIRARNINLITQVGFENFYVTRVNFINTSSDQNTFYFRNAANGWVCGIESFKTQYHHLRTETVIDLTIKNNYFHHSYNYNADHGYGVRCGYHVGSLLVENNIFFTLRHAMLVEQGASGNVYLNNYANNLDDASKNRMNSPGELDQATISIHGLYCNMNLFEGNIVEEIECTDAFGAAGPGNTFLRNRVISQGFRVANASNNQNIIGNEFTAGSGNIIYYSGSTTTGTFLHGNNINGTISYDANSGTEVANSYFYKSKPSYWGNDGWPSIGPAYTINSGTNPAKQRYDASNFLLLFECSTNPTSCPKVQNLSGNTLVDQDMTYIYSVTPDGKSSTVYAWTVPSGAIIVSGQGTNSISVNFPQGISGGDIEIKMSNEYGSDAGLLAVTVNAVTVIQADGKATNFILYPNPFKEEIKIETTLKSTEGFYVSISNIQGMMIFRQAYNSNIFSVGKDLIPGIYIIEIQSGESSIRMRIEKQP